MIHYKVIVDRNLDQSLFYVIIIVGTDEIVNHSIDYCANTYFTLSQ